MAELDTIGNSDYFNFSVCVGGGGASIVSAILREALPDNAKKYSMFAQ